MDDRDGLRLLRSVHVRRGLFNFGDLMFHTIAQQRGEPLLCARRNFASTDLPTHLVSRLSP